ncbi:MAG TPA: dihydroneopterin aldolase family protein [Methanoregulaceae archaeon]|nr:dihydroneopterin aldolase family protein [Methanoregulaceae archaeon]
MIMVTDREQAIFEAAIKLGALYHQWVGTPVSPGTAPLLAQAIEESVKLQPFVKNIQVHLDTDRMTPNPFGYSEVNGLMFDVHIHTRWGKATCHARLSPKGDYPMMEIVECNEDFELSGH